MSGEALGTHRGARTFGRINNRMHTVWALAELRYVRVQQQASCRTTRLGLSRVLLEQGPGPGRAQVGRGGRGRGPRASHPAWMVRGAMPEN